jgi:hypothetical protein
LISVALISVALALRAAGGRLIALCSLRDEFWNAADRKYQSRNQHSPKGIFVRH